MPKLNQKIKYLYFDMDNKQDADVYNTLEVIRYYQTRFVSMLVQDWVGKHNIDRTQPGWQAKLRDIVCSYIGVCPSRTVRYKGSVIDLNDEQYRMLMDMIADPHAVPADTAPIQEVKDDIPSVKTGTVRPPCDDDDDFADNAAVSSMLSGFASMSDD